MRHSRKHLITTSPRFPAFRVGNGNRDAQRLRSELQAIATHSQPKD
ncbi:hypothetical protein KV102_06020 [Mumia sp. zg.B53]|nr:MULTISPECIES: hypothetical protein [unclassified Mumia]MBW9207861.1 hypothetical protein [Mumia sp. zg.B17]MBW9209793.1 hypothetical protein [Mumia sp. zg.B21]MBW9214396.1 hypothetical protein [Mumia sp. zg.B53]MDD9348670.1 hypothetical protein [Mumia sp.]